MSVPPQVSTHKTHKAPLSAQNDQFSRHRNNRHIPYQQQNEYNQKQYQIQLQTDTNESRGAAKFTETHHKINIENSQRTFNEQENLHKKRPYFIDLTINDDDNGFEFDFQPTRVPSSHIQAKSQPNLINQSQFATIYCISSSFTTHKPDQSSTLLSTIQHKIPPQTTYSLPEDDDELQDWILEILKDPNFPQFISRVEKLWKVRLLAYDL
ncbi:unnamed protein product [Rhizophagus irregularis]|nr:unnamed protein product [Rhizophagus irregularis]